MSAQDIIQGQGVVRIGDVAPNFVQNSTKGSLDFYQQIEGKWALLLSHPRAMTPICTTEYVRLAQLQKELAALNTVPVGLSVDTKTENTAWAADIEEIAGVPVDYPIVADIDYAVTKLYGMVNQEHVDANGMPFTVRSVFFIGPDKKVKAIITYPANVGRSFDEILRVLKALQLSTEQPVACPVDWAPGKKIVVPPTVSDADAQAKYKDLEVVKPYLRYSTGPQ